MRSLLRQESVWDVCCLNPDIISEGSEDRDKCRVVPQTQLCVALFEFLESTGDCEWCNLKLKHSWRQGLASSQLHAVQFVLSESA